MLDECNVLLTETGHLIVESFHAPALNGLATLDDHTKAQRPVDPRHDYVPHSDVDEGMFFRAYLFFAS